jgi:predicted nuclease with TOPRIM domain
MLEWGDSKPHGDHPASSEELQELKDENERLRKSLTLLQAHSLSLKDRLDTLLAEEEPRLGACETVALRIREVLGSDDCLGPLAEHLDENI